ncbi:MAG: phosphohistidine phosphatase SixA [Candidatus Hinthialibacter antarcticus]|nr:phosphohistidine phosphatase SixA [Candidatus Hinthialibacter antarcticus]
MELYIIRHAIAVDRFDAEVQSDAERWLTDEGIEKMKIAARGLASLIDGFDCIYTSPYRRAKETAQIVADALPAPIEELGELQPGVEFGLIAKMLQSKTDDCVALVGHEPDLSELISESISATMHARVLMKKGAVARIDFPSQIAPGFGTLAWLLQPKQLRALGQ